MIVRRRSLDGLSQRPIGKLLVPPTTHMTARTADPAQKNVLTVSDVQRFLGKSKRAFYQLRRDVEEGFPAPFVIQGRDHWLKSDVFDWIQSRRRRDSVPGRTVLAAGNTPCPPRMRTSASHKPEPSPATAEAARHGEDGDMT